MKYKVIIKFEIEDKLDLNKIQLGEFLDMIPSSDIEYIHITEPKTSQNRRKEKSK